MKKILLLLFLAFYGLTQAQNFVIVGNVKKIRPKVETVMLYYARNGQNILDSVSVKNGIFKFQGTISQPTRADILIKYKGGKQPDMSADMKTIFIEAGELYITATNNFTQATVSGSGSNAHKELEKMQAMAKPYLEAVSKMSKNIETSMLQKDFKAMEAQETLLNNIHDSLKEHVYKTYIEQNPHSPIALFALQQYAGTQPKDELKVYQLFQQLSPQAQNSSEGKKMQKLIEYTMRSSIGNTAPNFEQANQFGEKITLEQFKGKYVLLHFWASWCASCRAETPQLIELHQRTANQNFAIISVSLDKPNEKNKWLSAIKNDKMTWTQVADLQFWNNHIAVLYGITSLPQNILIDPQGKIIAKNIRGKALIDTIEQIMLP